MSTVVVVVGGTPSLTSGAPAGTVVVAIPMGGGAPPAGLGEAAHLDLGTTAGTVAAGDDHRFTQLQEFVKYPAGAAITKLMAVALIGGQVFPMDSTNSQSLFGYIGIASADCAMGAVATIQTAGEVDVSTLGFANGGAVFAYGTNGEIVDSDPSLLPLEFPMRIGVTEDSQTAYIEPDGVPFFQIQSFLGIQSAVFGMPLILREVPVGIGGTGANNATDALANLQAAHMAAYAPTDANSPCASPTGFYIDGNNMRVYNGTVWKTFPLQDWI